MRIPKNCWISVLFSFSLISVMWIRAFYRDLIHVAFIFIVVAEVAHFHCFWETTKEYFSCSYFFRSIKSEALDPLRSPQRKRASVSVVVVRPSIETLSRRRRGGPSSRANLLHSLLFGKIKQKREKHSFLENRGCLPVRFFRFIAKHLRFFDCFYYCCF